MLITQVETKQILDENGKVHLRRLHDWGIDLVFISFCDVIYETEEYNKRFQDLGRSIQILKNEGFSVGVWTNSLGYGIPRPSYFNQRFEKATRLTSFAGLTTTAVCTLDQDFLAYMQENVRNIIRAGADLILWDDDLVQSVRPGFCCSCDLHLDMLGKRTGQVWRREDLPALFTGAPNKNRSVYMDCMGDSMMQFCRALRDAADEIDPSVRMGLCASYTHYDAEGVDLRELLRVLAGEGNQPMLRLSGAPYWATVAPRFPRQRVTDIVESVRLQIGWYRDTDVDLQDENDPAPRRHEWVPASHIELYDKMMIGNGGAHRHKYLLCDQYGKDLAYQTAHLAHLADDAVLTHMFGDTSPCGYRVYQSEKLLRDAHLPDQYIGDGPIMARFSQPFGGIFLSRNAIPTQYDKDGTGIVCGEHARMLTKAQREQGLLMDAPAAKLLMEAGVDVGLAEIPVPVEGNPAFYALKPATGATQISLKPGEGATQTSLSDPNYPTFVTYQNSQGHRFAIIGCDLNAAVPCEGIEPYILYNAEVQAQLVEIYAYLAQKPLPARVFDCPGLHLLAAKSEDESRLSILLSNVWDDSIEHPVIETDGAYQVVRTVGCQAKTDGKYVRLTKLHAYEYAAVELIRK